MALGGLAAGIPGIRAVYLLGGLLADTAGLAGLRRIRRHPAGAPAR